MKWILILQLASGGNPVQIPGFASKEECHQVGYESIRRCGSGIIRLCKTIGTYVCVPDPNNGIA